ncbi:MAG: hypothetical protein BWY99_00377 [Synergistetes bacterium ADurb.BinA166]|nr:MAG: hypothetical protein BWY99_00377 [Synergistetes bacterium ADurb.BinA166]
MIVADPDEEEAPPDTDPGPVSPEWTGPDVRIEDDDGDYG